MAEQEVPDAAAPKRLFWVTFGGVAFAVRAESPEQVVRIVVGSSSEKEIEARLLRDRIIELKAEGHTGIIAEW